MKSTLINIVNIKQVHVNTFYVHYIKNMFLIALTSFLMNFDLEVLMHWRHLDFHWKNKRWGIKYCINKCFKQNKIAA